MIDELFLAVRTATGLFVLTGCCHAGVINTLEHAKALSNGERIAVVAGGLHLAGCGAERLEATAGYLVRSGTGRAKTGHCSGKDEERALAALAGGIVSPFECGSTLVL
jgi:7,8-dihydropterin-6-yl-methyl-4-(beta-D-ribofuranosyl)aminobenzene 5'-phosphate synthase